MTSKFVRKTSRKRKREQNRKKSFLVKRRRKELKKEKARKKDRSERKEGHTYESGIGVTPEGQEITKGIINGMLKDVTDEEMTGITSSMTNELETESTLEKDGVYECFSFDLETTGLKRDSEIIQIACVSLKDIQHSFNEFAVPDGEVSPSASKVNHLTISFKEGKKVLMKDNRTVAAEVLSQQAVTAFLDFLDREKTKGGNAKIVLISHNGDSFDFPVFINSLARYSVLERAKAIDLMFLDSLKVFRSTDKVGKNISMSLSSIYQRIFGKEFDAHDLSLIHI